MIYTGRKKIISLANRADSTTDARITTLENNEYKITYFAEINATTGTITIPTGATILLDQLQGGVDAYVSEITNGQPNGNFPRTSGGVTVDVSSFNALGTYTLSGTPSGYPVALIYILKIKAKYYSNLTIYNILDMEDNPNIEDRIDSLQSTGVTGGTGVSINGGNNTKFDINVEGVIVDPDTFEQEYVSINLTAQTVTNLAQKITYVRVSSGGTVIQQASPSTTEQLYSSLGEFVLIHTNGTSLNAVNNYPNNAGEIGVQLHSFMRNVGILNLSGNVISQNGANLKLNKSAGIISRVGVGNLDSDNPNELVLASLTAPSTMRLRTQTGVETANTDVIDTDNYDFGGVVTSLPTANDYQIYRVNIFSSNLLRLQYGQNIYSSIVQAEASIASEPFVTETNIRENGLLIGYIIVRRGTTNLTDTSRCKIIPANKFGSGPASGGIIPTLQNTYDSSSTPEITTDSIRGAFTIKEGTGTDTNNVYESKNYSGTTTWSVNGNGDVTERNSTINGTGGNGYQDYTNQSSSPSSPSSGINRLFTDSIGKLSKTMSNGTKSTYRGKIYSDTVDSSALTGSTSNTLMKSGLVKGNSFNPVTDIIRIESLLKKTGTAGTCDQRYYVNTSNSLSGATLLGTQSSAATGTFIAMIRNGVIKSTTNTEFATTTTSLSSDDAGAAVLGSGGVTSINIDWSIDQYIIQAAQNSNNADSTKSSFLKIYRD